MIPYAIITSTGIASLLLGVASSRMKTKTAILLGIAVVVSCGIIAISLSAGYNFDGELATAIYVVLVTFSSLFAWGVSRKRG